MVGPTKQQVEGGIARDRDAYCGASCRSVKNGKYPISLRAAVVRLHDPIAGAQGTKSGEDTTLSIRLVQ